MTDATAPTPADSNPSARILAEVCRFFLESTDFNGITLAGLGAALSLSCSDLRLGVTSLLEAHHIELSFASHTENPHIKRIPGLPLTDQINRLASEDPTQICAYPAAEVVRQSLDLQAHGNRPYSARLLLAEPQLTPVFFELSVLERYFPDPRYAYSFRDFAGSISIRGRDGEKNLRAQDQVFLESFGIGYDGSRNRVVVVYLRYLNDLTPEHQQYWKTHELPPDACVMNSDYEGASLWGTWPRFHSVYEGFLHEQAQINALANLMGKPPFFKKTFDEERPDRFAPMLRPTRRNFEAFVHLLDKMLSDNINLDFFRGDIPLEERTVADDGSAERKPLGTLVLFERWLSARYRTADGEDAGKEVLAPLRTVRRLRQRPAHALTEDAYDPTFPRQQDELLAEVIHALTKIRLIFNSHPRARSYVAPDWLDDGRIVFY
jgi:hypothetical protein